MQHSAPERHIFLPLLSIQKEEFIFSWPLPIISCLFGYLKIIYYDRRNCYWEFTWKKADNIIYAVLSFFFCFFKRTLFFRAVLCSQYYDLFMKWPDSLSFPLRDGLTFYLCLFFIINMRYIMIKLRKYRKWKKPPAISSLRNADC